jgi:hypothetical protein
MGGASSVAVTGSQCWRSGTPSQLDRQTDIPDQIIENVKLKTGV